MLGKQGLCQIVAGQNDLFVDYYLSLAHITPVNINPFETMSAENPNDRLVQLSPAECAEANAYYDALADAAESDDGPHDGDDVSEFDDEPDEQPGDEPNDDMDGDAASALASAGFGTDEDYGGGTHFEDVASEY